MHNGLDIPLTTHNHRRGVSFVQNCLMVAVWVSLSGAPLLATETETPAARVERIYRQCQTRFAESPTNVEAAWQFGRACFDWADFPTDDERRAAIAEEGISACRRALALKYKSAPAHYYLALNLGQLARTKSIGALKLVRQMESEFKKTIEMDEKFDFAGPHRSLGLLYKDAPGWPTSIGSRGKARLHLQRANALSREYPDNRLSLAEAYMDWGETRAVMEEIPSLKEALEKARKKLTGEEWTLSWRDWDARFEKLKNKAHAAAGRAASPRGSK